MPPIESSRPELHKIPATVVTGFLGSGKTTLLSHLLRNAGGKRIAVIVNEFGELDVDAELVRSCQLEACEENEVVEREQGVFELANGCICCTVEEEFLPVMQKLVERRDQIDHILIETSGLALPKPLVQAFNWPDIKQFCTVDSVITVVDGPALAAGRVAHDHERIEAQRQADESLDHDPSLQELLDDQLASADLVIISKGDALDDEARRVLEQQLRGELPERVKTLWATHGEVDVAAVMGMQLASEGRADDIHTHHDDHHAHGREHHHAHDDFDSCVITLASVDSKMLVQALEQELAEQTIYRVKGFVDVGKPMRQVLHAVGNRLTHHFDRPWRSDETRQTRLVVIGKHLDRDRLQAALAEAEQHERLS
ncbi:cobalamin biosynthesis protein CobW [Kushneria indalinina]|uniref:Cobalamin biosynthesis protein CobW n=1 Tax=Kushneria indalinina DSM 14324 TaxID=1122140 RepID=A0A3D9E105_9GAMM|nr:cobalamin biosynthesis protein CobW [Kushneria indalinina]REC96154.1 cobalamin biosynthesis protein CobW [Kushneria indalinina DSM 14324]